MTSLSEIQGPKESAESILRVLRVANGDLRKRAKEAEQKIESQQRKIKQMESDHQVVSAFIKQPIIYHNYHCSVYRAN